MYTTIICDLEDTKEKEETVALCYKIKRKKKEIIKKIQKENYYISFQFFILYFLIKVSFISYYYIIHIAIINYTMVLTY